MYKPREGSDLLLDIGSEREEPLNSRTNTLLVWGVRNASVKGSQGRHDAGPDLVEKTNRWFQEQDVRMEVQNICTGAGLADSVAGEGLSVGRE